MVCFNHRFCFRMLGTERDARAKAELSVMMLVTGATDAGLVYWCKIRLIFLLDVWGGRVRG